MFLNITNFNRKTKEEVLETLKQLGVEFEEHVDGLHQFFDQEGDFRLDMYLEGLDEDDYSPEIIEKLHSEEVYREISSGIAKAFMDGQLPAT